ncbi:MAG: hypothetical protein ACP5M0_10240 [Desulfomonilaceae bacterium]
MFSLDDMVVKFQDLKAEQGPTLTVDDYVHIAKEGNEVTMHVSLEFFPAVENFGNRKEARTFLVANFDCEALGATHQCQRCMASYATEREAEEKPRQVRIANDRLSKLYVEFEQAGIHYEKRFFE